MPVTTTVPTVASYTGGLPRLSSVSTFDTDMDNFLPFLGNTLPAAVQAWTTAVNAVATQINTTAAAAATSESNAALSASSAATNGTKAQGYAITLGAVVPGTSDYSAREWAVGTTVPAGSAMEWAVMAPGTTVNGTEYSAKHYAQSALNAPGTSATSTTSFAIPIAQGPLTLTIQTGKAYSIGQFLVIASTVSPANFVIGQITAYNGSTGSITVQVISFAGSGTFAAWSVALTAISGITADGAATLNNKTLSNGTKFQGDALAQLQAIALSF